MVHPPSQTTKRIKIMPEQSKNFENYFLRLVLRGLGVETVSKTPVRKTSTFSICRHQRILPTDRTSLKILTLSVHLGLYLQQNTINNMYKWYNIYTTIMFYYNNHSLHYFQNNKNGNIISCALHSDCHGSQHCSPVLKCFLLSSLAKIIMFCLLFLR